MNNSRGRGGAPRLAVGGCFSPFANVQKIMIRRYSGGGRDEERRWGGFNVNRFDI